MIHLSYHLGILLKQFLTCPASCCWFTAGRLGRSAASLINPRTHWCMVAKLGWAIWVNDHSSESMPHVTSIYISTANQRGWHLILALFLIASQVAQLAINIIEKGDKLTTFCIEHGDHQLFSVIESEHLWVNLQSFCMLSTFTSKPVLRLYSYYYSLKKVPMTGHWCFMDVTSQEEYRFEMETYNGLVKQYEGCILDLSPHLWLCVTGSELFTWCV